MPVRGFTKRSLVRKSFIEPVRARVCLALESIALILAPSTRDIRLRVLARECALLVTPLPGMD